MCVSLSVVSLCGVRLCVRTYGFVCVSVCLQKRTMKGMLRMSTSLISCPTWMKIVRMIEMDDVEEKGRQSRGSNVNTQIVAILYFLFSNKTSLFSKTV